MNWDGNDDVIFVNDTTNVTVYIWNDIFSYYDYDNPVCENGNVVTTEDVNEIINLSNLNRKLQSHNPTY